MEGMEAARGDRRPCPSLLDLIPNRGVGCEEDETRKDYGIEDERKLELRLGLPGKPSSSLSLGILPVRAPRPSHGKASASRPVGWPPVRSFRKNVVSSGSKQKGETEDLEKSKASEVNRKKMMVKINMEGMPIGRKIDLEAHHSYDELTSAVEELFRGLLATQSNRIRRKASHGLLNESGDYTLVYEDDEGDVLLVGDVPWDMFVSAVKRLRVMKSSEISSSLSVTVVDEKRRAAAAGCC